MTLGRATGQPVVSPDHHTGGIEAALSLLQVILVDQCDEEKDMKKTEDIWMCNLGTLFVGLNSHNEVLLNKRRNFGNA